MGHWPIFHVDFLHDAAKEKYGPIWTDGIAEGERMAMT